MNNLEFNVDRDWDQSKLYEIVVSTKGGGLIYKVNGTPKKSEFVFLDNKLGYLTISMFDPKNNESIMVSQNKVSDIWLYSYFSMHPTQPIILYSQDIQGAQNHDIVKFNYKTNESNVIAKKVGSITTFEIFGEEGLIVSVNRKTGNSVLKVSLDGEISELYTTTDQILSSGASKANNLVAVSVGRNNAKIIVLDTGSGKIVTTISETEESNENRPIFSENLNYLIYQTNVSGSANHLVIRSIDDWKEQFRVKLPGEIGFFVIDQNYYSWISPDELAIVVSNKAESNPRVLNLKTKDWSDPLTTSTVVGGISNTKNGIIWSAGNSTKTDFVETYSNGVVETLIPPHVINTSVRVESHKYTSLDGTEVQGWLIRNSKNPNGKLIVMVHGGPTYVDLDKWDDQLNLYTTAGYHVFRPNYRGSTTFGSKFMLANAGDMGGGDLEDIYSGAKYVIELLNLDTKPIVTGVSYGGYLALLAVGKYPDFWAGGYSNVPIGDLLGWYDLASAHYKQLIQKLIGGKPEGIRQKYKERSPLTYINKIKAPVLITAGIYDPNSYFPQIENYFNKAKELHKPVFLKSYEAGHGGPTGENALLKNTMILEFFKNCFSK